MEDTVSTRTWQLITDDILLDGAKRLNIDEAVSSVMEKVGITDGSIAAVALDAYANSWPKMTAGLRVQALEQWREAEREADIDYGPKNLYATLALAGLRLLGEHLNSLPPAIREILAEDNIFVRSADERAQLTEDIDAACERINFGIPDEAVVTIIRDLLPYARSRLEELREAAEDGVSVDGDLAEASINVAYRLIGEEP